MQHTLLKLKQLYNDSPRLTAVLAGIAMLTGLTLIHGMLGFTSAFRVIYVLPIWIATRMGGKRAGIALVLLSTVVGTMTEWQLQHGPQETLWANLMIRFATLGVLMLLIAQVELALQKHQKLALTDPLTGLLNRYALKEFASSAFNRALLLEKPMTVVMIDCDGFKKLNDTFGHKAGDHVLTLLARSIERHTRQTDLVARLGGDEFAVVFQDTDIEEAKNIMKRIDEAFTTTVSDAGYVASLSIGYGVRSQDYNELETVLEIADAAMYEHKQNKKANAFLN
jgi:diguanylate cyclase (GGDEF)-like protein